MENVVTRHRNLVILVALLFAQVIGLAVQVKRPTDHGATLLIRIWAVRVITPLDKAVVYATNGISSTWHNYVYLRGVRKENAELRDQIQELRLQQVRLSEDAGQARRLQALLGFKEQFISKTVPAQVISTTGTEFSHAIYIDKGSKDGVRADMPVITAEGVIGKVLRAFPSSSLVLLLSDPSSGAGVILEQSRLQGILKGTAGGETLLQNIMSDEKVKTGEAVLTSGGDGIYPKGLPVGTVTNVSPGPDLFLRIRVKPAAHLDRLEEVLVITAVEQRPIAVDQADAPIRAADILAQRLPTVPAGDPLGTPAPTSSLPAPTRTLPASTSGVPAPTASLPPVEGKPRPETTQTAKAAEQKAPATATSSMRAIKGSAPPAAQPGQGRPASLKETQNRTPKALGSPGLEPAREPRISAPPSENGSTSKESSQPKDGLQ